MCTISELSCEEDVAIGTRVLWPCARRDSPRNPAVSLVAATGRCPAADLLHQGKQVSDAPVVRDLSVLHTHHINRFEMNLAIGRSNSKKRTAMRPVVGFEGRHSVAVRKLPVDFGVKIGEGLTYVRIELPHACLVW